MSFWDDVSGGVKEAAEYTAKKAGELTAIAKLKIALKNEESRLEKCFEAMGKIYYRSVKKDEDNSQKLLELVGTADGIKCKITNLKKEISDVQNLIVCPGCGERIKADCEFCPKCGQKTDEE